jgi:peptidase E
MKLLGIGSRINHSVFGVGVVTNVTSKHYWVTFIENGLETIEIDSEFTIIEAVEDEVDTISFYEVEKSLKNLLQKWSDVTEISPIADRWKKGTLILRSADTNLADKQIPIDTFFHKIVMVRDKVRVIEQKN